MTLFQRQDHPTVEAELAAASQSARRGRGQESFRHLERAHILGQTSTVQHVRVHWEMLRWGWRHRDVREVFGQILRMAGAAVATPLGMLPLGNTGGANVSPFRSMPIPQDLTELLPFEAAGGGAKKAHFGKMGLKFFQPAMTAAARSSGPVPCSPSSATARWWVTPSMFSLCTLLSRQRPGPEQP